MNAAMPAGAPSLAAPGAAAGAAVVAIGRNEGERLRRCLQSVAANALRVVYVDSGSTDGSVETARGLGAEVIALDMARPFTAARARNEGWRRLLDGGPALAYVQFVDGDCEVVEGWIDQARTFLDAHPEVGAVAGRNRERHPERSVYNLLCDAEWASGTVGSADACGGNAMMRLAALLETGGFRETLIAGEEPELCLRMRAAGWTIWRLGAEMTLHDAAMTRFHQWWKRTMRTGFSYAEAACLPPAGGKRLWRRESRSAWIWGLAIPGALLVAAALLGPAALWGGLVYPLQVLRLFLRASGPARVRALRAFFLVLGKFPEVAGQIKYRLHRLSGTRGRLIEYK